MSDLPHALMATISKIGKDSAGLEFANGQTIDWPKRLLPKNLNIGDKIHLLALADEDTDLERRRLAKQVLNEMLSGE